MYSKCSLYVLSLTAVYYNNKIEFVIIALLKCGPTIFAFQQVVHVKRIM